MSDYTPTTEEVSGIYWWRKLTDRYGVNAVYRNHTEEEAQFDRWLAGVKAQACNHTFAQQLEEHSLAELIRMAKADGFDEGWDARVNAETITPTENPYRQGETE